MTGIIQRYQGLIPSNGLEHINGTGFLTDMPETFITQPQHTKQDDPVDDRMADQDEGLPGMLANQFVYGFQSADS